MTADDRHFDDTMRRLREEGLDVDAILAALSAFQVETPSWGYGDSGTPSPFPSPACRATSSRSSRTRPRCTA